MVRFLDLVRSVLELDAFPAVCLLDGGRERGRNGWSWGQVNFGVLAFRRHGGEASITIGGVCREVL